MSATGAFARIGLSGSSVEMIAARTHERGFSARVLEERVIPTIIEHPQPQKKSRDKQAVDDRGGGEIHAATKTDWLSPQTQS
jgi:hypothetical protein